LHSGQPQLIEGTFEAFTRSQNVSVPPATPHHAPELEQRVAATRLLVSLRCHRPYPKIDFRWARFKCHSRGLLLATSDSTCSRPSFVGQPGIFSSNPRTSQDAFNSFS